MSRLRSHTPLIVFFSLSISIPRRIILRTNDQTPPLLRALVDRLDNINQLLLILQHPVELVVVAGAEIAHHVLVAEEEHEGDGIVEFVHLLEVGDLVEVADVDDGEVLDAVGDLVEDFVLPHAVGIPVAAEADHDQAVFFGHDGLVDVPAGDEVGDDDGAHLGGSLVCWLEVCFRSAQIDSSRSPLWLLARLIKVVECCASRFGES